MVCSYTYNYTQIADFGMARDVADDNYYVTTGGKIPLKWTSPEVCNSISHTVHCYNENYILSYRQYFTRNIQYKVMCGALDV